MRSLFPENVIETNVRNLGIVGFSGAQLEIDVFLPELALGFEYQVRKEGEKEPKRVKIWGI